MVLIQMLDKTAWQDRVTKSISQLAITGSTSSITGPLIKLGFSTVKYTMTFALWVLTWPCDLSERCRVSVSGSGGSRALIMHGGATKRRVGPSPRDRGTWNVCLGHWYEYHTKVCFYKSFQLCQNPKSIFVAVRWHSDMVTVSLESQRADRGGIMPHHDRGVVNTWAANTRLRQGHQVIINWVTTEASPHWLDSGLASILINCVRIFRCGPAPRSD